MASEKEETGYKKPPKDTRFPKGQSGNPKGRPKGAKNLKTILLKELETQISVQEGGRLKKITKQEAFIKSLIANSLKGEHKSSRILVRLITNLLTDNMEAPLEENLPEEDMKILEKYLGK